MSIKTASPTSPKKVRGFKVLAPTFSIEAAKDEWEVFGRFVADTVRVDNDRDVSEIQGILKMIDAVFAKYGNDVTTEQIKDHMKLIYVKTLITAANLPDVDAFICVLFHENIVGNSPHLYFLSHINFFLKLETLQNFLRNHTMPAISPSVTRNGLR